jgi:hypothetical protein
VNKIITPSNAGSLTVGADADDPFAMVFAPARPALNAARKLKPLFDWLERYDEMKREYPHLHVKRANEHQAAALERCEQIPADRIMYAVDKVFRAAEFEAAPEPWLHAAIGLMLDSMPNAKNTSPSYRFALVDAMMHDPDVFGGYGPGFSHAVLAQSVREIRRTAEFVPSHATFLKLCSSHRSQFQKWQWSVSSLIDLRQNAEDVLIATGDLKVPEDGWGI